MADFGAPSFSLGLDLDFDSEPRAAPREEPLFKQAAESSSNVSFQTFEDDVGYQPQALDPGIRNEDPPPVLKRLKRGPATQWSGVSKRQPVQFTLNVDDEIEDFSSPEDQCRDEHSAIQNHSLCGSSKSQLHGHRVLTTQSVSKVKVRKSTPASTASTSANFEAGSNKLMFPKLTRSPLRRFQLLDSDSDDPSASGDICEDAGKVDVSAKGRQCSPTHYVIRNQLKAKSSASTFQTEDLWKDFSPKKLNIPTPTLDEFCDEYFRSVKNKNVSQRSEEGLRVNSCKGYQKSSISENVKHYGNRVNPLPPAYRYFYHDDPRIRILVRNRLVNFSPLGDVNNRGNEQSDVASIDYMSQFGHSDHPTQFHGTGNKAIAGSSKRSRKNTNSNAKEVSQVSGSWVNPKSSGRIPTNAGKRRVHADGRSAARWFTGQDGKRVYVAKNGQELTGRSAYMHYRKESGAGSRRFKKKATAKKKSKR